jgi:hypothetical protein
MTPRITAALGQPSWPITIAGGAVKRTSVKTRGRVSAT